MVPFTMREMDTKRVRPMYSSWSKDKASLLEGRDASKCLSLMCMLSRNRKLQLKLKLLLLFIATML